MIPRVELISEDEDVLMNSKDAFNHLHDICEPCVSCYLATPCTPDFTSIFSKTSLITRLEEMEVILMKEQLCIHILLWDGQDFYLFI